MISVIIVEDNADIRIMLEAIVNSSPDYNCLATAASGTEALEQIRRHLPNVVLMDIGLPDINGIDCIRLLRSACAGTEFMMCTIHDEDEKVFEALQAGANSYLLKSSTPETILSAIRELHEGGSPMSSDIARKIVRQLQRPNTATNDHGVTQREQEILQLLSRGHTYQEISDQLFISIKTFKKHVYNIYRKLQVNNKTEAMNKYFGR